MALCPYNPATGPWYWSVQDASPGTQVWSSLAGAYVALADATYVGWLVAGCSPTSIDTKANLNLVLSQIARDAYRARQGNPINFLSISGTTQLTNPLLQMYYIDADADNRIVKLPQANLFNSLPVGDGSVIICNDGSKSIQIQDFSGNSITAIYPGETHELRNITFSTINGTWVGSVYAAGTAFIGVGTYNGSSVISRIYGTNTGLVENSDLYLPTQRAVKTYVDVGTATNNDAAAGNKGEYVEGSLSFASRTSLTTTVAKTLCSISLTAGDWDVTGLVGVFPANTTNVRFVAGSTHTVTNTEDPTAENKVGVDFGTAGSIADANYGASLAVPRKRYSLSGTTTIYLIIRSDFTVSTNTGYGKISARRVR